MLISPYASMDMMRDFGENKICHFSLGLVGIGTLQAEHVACHRVLHFGKNRMYEKITK